MDDLNLESHMDNIKKQQYDLEFFGSFDICLNALDNLSARTHINRMCLACKTPLIESGTQGFMGQVTSMFKKTSLGNV